MSKFDKMFGSDNNDINTFFSNDMVKIKLNQCIQNENMKLYFIKLIENEFIKRDFQKQIHELLGSSTINDKIDTKVNKLDMTIQNKITDLKNKITNLKNDIIRSIDNELPQKARKQLELLAPNIAKEQIQNYINTYLAKQVENEIIRQIPLYLNNNHEMNIILAAHKDDLNIRLGMEVHRIVSSICNEEQYQYVRNEWSRAMNERSNYELNENINKFNVQLNNNQYEFNNELDNMKKSIYSTSSIFRSEISKVTTLEQNMDRLHKLYIVELDQLKKQCKANELLCNWTFGIVTVGIIGFCAMIKNYNKI